MTIITDKHLIDKLSDWNSRARCDKCNTYCDLNYWDLKIDLTGNIFYKCDYCGSNQTVRDNYIPRYFFYQLDKDDGLLDRNLRRLIIYSQKVPFVKQLAVVGYVCLGILSLNNPIVSFCLLYIFSIYPLGLWIIKS